jgi:peptide/nickel transport system substrate-binding protein
MSKNKFQMLFAFVLLASLLLVACKPAAATEAAAPAAEEAAPAAEEAAPAEASTGYLWTPVLREAIAAAIDREALVDRVFEGRNTPAYGMVPPSYPYATEPFMDKYGTRNLDMAKQLLTEAGYSESNPFAFDLWYPPEHYGTTTADVMQVIKEQLEETGMIKVNLQSMNWAEYVDGFVAGDLPLFMLGWFPDFVDPDNWLTPFASCLQSPDNGVNYCNPDMDKLLQSAASATDTTERGNLYKQIGELYANEVPTIPLFWEPEYITFRNGIQGVAIGGSFEFNYNVLSFADGYKTASGDPDTIIIGTTDEVNSLDADDAYSTHDWEIIKNTGLALMAYTPGTTELVPGAAAAAPVVSDDGLTYTYTLKDGLAFADGTPLKASDYVYSWDRLNTLQGQVSGLVQVYVKSVEAPDDKTVVYHLNQAVGFFPALSATGPFVPVNQAEFKADAINQFPEKLDGIGRYKMVSHVPGEQMVLEANSYYTGDDAAKIKKVIIKYFADPTTMANAVEKGEIDVAWRTLGPVESTRLQAIDGLTVVKVDAPSLRYLVFNNTYKAPAK